MDTAGEEDFQNMADNWINFGEGFLLVFAINDKESFDILDKKRARILKVKFDKPCPIVLVGNKLDLNNDRKVSFPDAKKKADELKKEVLNMKSIFNTKKALTGIVEEDGSISELKANGQKTQADAIVEELMSRINSLETVIEGAVPRDMLGEENKALHRRIKDYFKGADVQGLFKEVLKNNLSDVVEAHKALAAEKGFSISDEQIAQGLAVMQNLYGQYQRGEQMDLSSVMAAFMGGEDNGLASLASMFMGGQEEGQGADMMQLMSMLNGSSSADSQQGADLAQMAQMFMGAQGQAQGNDDMAQLAQMFMANMDKE